MSTNRGSWEGPQSSIPIPRRKGVTFSEPHRHSTGDEPTTNARPPPRPPRGPSGGAAVKDIDDIYVYSEPAKPTHRRVLSDDTNARGKTSNNDAAFIDAYDSFLYESSGIVTCMSTPEEEHGSDDVDGTYSLQNVQEWIDASSQRKPHDNDYAHGPYSMRSAGDGAYSTPCDTPHDRGVSSKQDACARDLHDSTELERPYSLQDAREWVGLYTAPIPREKRPPMGKQMTIPDTMNEAPAPKKRLAKGVRLRENSGRLGKSGSQALPLTMHHYTKVTDDKVKLILELRSPGGGSSQSDRAPMRLVCLFDISGSMLQKCGTKRTDGKHRETKLAKMKNVARILTKTLDDEDYLGILAFGSEADVIFPLTRLVGQAKKEAFTTVRKLGKNGLSVKTNLGKGLLSAIDMFRKSSSETGVKSLETRDVIVVMTDGEINDGITDGQVLVKEVRQAIRDFEMESRHYCKDPSLTISTVVTGNDVSEAVYLLSKTCGNDAYYYISKETDATELAAMMPVLLRKANVASSISLKVEAQDPAELIPKFCSHEYMAHRPHETDDEINYFIHDLGWGMSKHLSIILDKDSVFCVDDADAVLVRVDVEYKDRLLNKRSLVHTVTRRDIGENVPVAVVAVCLQDVRRISQIALRSVADWVKANDVEKAVAQLNQCKVDVRKELQKYAKMTSEKSATQKMTGFINSVVTNLGNLLTVIEDTHQSAGHKWSTVKAVSSAIVRETPSVPELVVEEENIYNVKSVAVELSDLKNFIKKHYKSVGMQSCIFGDFDQTMTELHNTLPRYEPGNTSADPWQGDNNDPCGQDDIYTDADSGQGENSNPSAQRDNNDHFQRLSGSQWSDDEEYTYSSELHKS